MSAIKDAKKLIQDWFFSDLAIELFIKHLDYPKQRLILRLESDAYYLNGQRHKGQHRYLIVDCDSDDELYDEFEHEFSDFFHRELNLEDCLNIIDLLDEYGYKVS